MPERLLDSSARLAVQRAFPRFRCSRAGILVPLLLSACDLAPRYAVPATPATPAAYLESGPWTSAAPADATPRGPWWHVFNDPRLDTLEDGIERASPRLAAAVARYDQARATSRIDRADLFPTITANSNGQRGQTLMYGDEHDYAAGGILTYEIDLWGRVRNEVAAGRADAQASAAELAAMRLCLHAELAEDYLRLAGDDSDIQVLTAAADAYTRALDLTEREFHGGAISELDVDRARTQLSSARSDLDQLQADRAERQHAIADLLGLEPASLDLPPIPTQDTPPQIPPGAPSLLLQRRPDIAEAERRVFAANARIGQARAAEYPSLTLGGSAGYEQIMGTLLHASGMIWALGPAASALTVFDAGRHSAEVARTRAAFAESAATYRQTVLDAFRDVEDQLALINHLARAESDQQDAVQAASRTNTLANIQYRGGAVDYLDVVTAQTAELAARRTATDLQTRRLLAAVDLIRALGGGWTG